MSKNKKDIKVKGDVALDADKNALNEEDTEKEKESSTLSDGVLDAFDEEITPTDPLLLSEEDTIGGYENEEDEEDVGIDSGDYKPDDEW
jgi:predicted transglutaminase-like protease